MSTKVVAMTVTDSNSDMPADNKLACNINGIKTRNALLRLAGVILGISLIPVHYQETGNLAGFELLCLFLCNLSILLVASLLLLSYLISPTAAETLPKLFFELLHNIYAFLCYACISLALLIILATREGTDVDDEYDDEKEGKMVKKVITIAVLGLGNAAVYFTSSFYGYRTFKSS